MKILVTGSAGFIGSHVVDKLVREKHVVYGIDNLSNGFKRNVHPKSKFIHLDLGEKEKVYTHIEKIKPQLIFHLAADATEGRSQFTPLYATEQNYRNYLHILIAAINCKVKRIVVASSMSVYGNQKTPFSESLNPRPVDIYGVAKHAMEQATHILSKVHGFEYTIIRPHNVYGPRQNIADPYRNVIGIFLNRLMQKKRVYIYGDGSQKRSFSYIDDVAPYIANAGLSKHCRNEIINIGPQKSYSINEVFTEIIGHFSSGRKLNRLFEPYYLPERPQEVHDAICSDRKARALLEYKAQTSLSAGITAMVAWAKNLGPQKFKYLPELEINHHVPKTWSKKLL